jgi:hypothetical protein
MKVFLRKNAIVILLVFLCFISRVPQLLSDKMILDIDECVLGLMAKHQFEGKELSFIFWGQGYGFSFIETCFISASYAIGGISDDAVRLGMLAIWAIGIVFFYKALTRNSNGSNITALLICLVLILCPAWAVASMRTYVTPFAFCSILMFILLGPVRKTWHYLICGVLLSLIFATQPLFLVGLFPLLLYALYRDKNRQKTIALTVTTLIGFLFLLYMRSNSINTHNPHIFDTDFHNYLPNLRLIPFYLYAQTHGWYYLLEVQKPGIFSASFAYLFSFLVYFLLAAAIYYAIKKRKGSGWFIASAIGVFFTLLYTIFMVDIAPRYLLPVTGFTLLSLFFFIQLQARKQLLHVVLGLLIVLGSISLYNFKDYAFCKTREPELNVLIDKMLAENIHYAYCTGWMLQWQLTFYSKEKIIARHFNIPDRNPTYTKAVDAALYSRLPVAITGYTNEACGIQFPTPPIEVPQYFFYKDPSPKMLENCFKLWPASAYELQ